MVLIRGGFTVNGLAGCTDRFTGAGALGVGPEVIRKVRVAGATGAIGTIGATGTAGTAGTTGGVGVKPDGTGSGLSALGGAVRSDAGLARAGRLGLIGLVMNCPGG